MSEYGFENSEVVRIPWALVALPGVVARADV
jgi:hypothetical protein